MVEIRLELSTGLADSTLRGACRWSACARGGVGSGADCSVRAVLGWGRVVDVRRRPGETCRWDAVCRSADRNAADYAQAPRHHAYGRNGAPVLVLCRFVAEACVPASRSAGFVWPRIPAPRSRDFQPPTPTEESHDVLPHQSPVRPVGGRLLGAREPGARRCVAALRSGKGHRIRGGTRRKGAGSRAPRALPRATSHRESRAAAVSAARSVSRRRWPAPRTRCPAPAAVPAAGRAPPGRRWR